MPKVMFAASQIAPGASVVATLPPAYGGDSTGSHLGFLTVSLVPDGNASDGSPTYNAGGGVTIEDVNGNVLQTLAPNDFLNGVARGMAFQILASLQPITIVNSGALTIGTIQVADGQDRQ